MHWLDTYWMVMPTHHHHGAHFSLLDLSTLLGIGGVFTAGVFWQLRRRALVPIKDPRLAESLGFENA